VIKRFNFSIIIVFIFFILFPIAKTQAQTNSQSPTTSPNSNLNTEDPCKLDATFKENVENTDQTCNSVACRGIGKEIYNHTTGYKILCLNDKKYSCPIVGNYNRSGSSNTTENDEKSSSIKTGNISGPINYSIAQDILPGDSPAEIEGGYAITPIDSKMDSCIEASKELVEKRERVIRPQTTLQSQEGISPVNLVQTINNFMFYIAGFIFLMMIIINAIGYIQSKEDPRKLQEINKSLFNTFAGLLFVLLAGGFIISLISLFQ
jgi:hypothetical protein